MITFRSIQRRVRGMLCNSEIFAHSSIPTTETQFRAVVNEMPAVIPKLAIIDTSTSSDISDELFV